MKSLDRTLMSDGLEAAISKEQMSDLLAFLRSAGAPHPLRKNKADEGVRTPARGDVERRRVVGLAWRPVVASP